MLKRDISVNKDYYQNDEDLLKLLKQHKIANDKEIKEIIFNKIIGELSSIFSYNLVKSNIIINSNNNVISIRINIPISMSHYQLTKLMFNGLISLSPVYVNDDYDLGVKLLFNI